MFEKITESSLGANLQGPHGHACSVETIGSDVAIFSNFILTLSVTLWKNAKKNFIVRNRITLQAAILDCSEAAVHSHPFSKSSQGNIDGKVILLVKLQTNCL